MALWTQKPMDAVNLLIYALQINIKPLPFLAFRAVKVFFFNRFFYVF